MARITEHTVNESLYEFSSPTEDMFEQVPINADSPADSLVSIQPFSVARQLGAVTAVLVIVSTAAQYAYISTGFSSKGLKRLVKVFSVDLELNVPTFFSMLLFLTASVLLAYITVHLVKKNARYRWHWAILSFGFLLMAFDEIVAAHERMIEPLRALLGGENLGVFYFAWVVPGIALVLFLALIFIRFWLNLPSRTRWYFLIGAALFLGGAIGMELIDGRFAEIHGKNNMTYMVLASIEESLEMAGIIVFIVGLLDYIADNFDGIKISLTARTR